MKFISSNSYFILTNSHIKLPLQLGTQQFSDVLWETNLFMTFL
jgi:hypothetical protein